MAALHHNIAAAAAKGILSRDGGWEGVQLQQRAVTLTVVVTWVSPTTSSRKLVKGCPAFYV